MKSFKDTSVGNSVVKFSDNVTSYNEIKKQKAKKNSIAVRVYFSHM